MTQTKTNTKYGCKMISSYSHFFFLKYRIRKILTNILTTINTGYPYLLASSGIFLKFMPYHPTIRVSGRKIAVIRVKNFIREFYSISI